MSPARRACIVTAALLAGTLTVGTVHQFALGKAGVEECQEAILHNDLPRAIDAAHAAAEAVAPTSPYPERGYALLTAIATAAEGRGDDPNAAAAWRSVRAATLATQGLALSSPHLTEANEGLARVAWHGRSGAMANDPAAFRDSMLTALARNDAPAGWQYLLLGAGALGLLGGVVFVLGTSRIWRR